MNKETLFEDMDAIDTQKVKAYLEGAGEVAKTEEIAENPQSNRVENTDEINLADDERQSEDKSKEDIKEEINEQKIGKFKNPQELLRAYGELEKEFTRRSQRLKELESAKKSPMDGEAWKSAVDKFFKEIPSAKAFAKDIANEIMQNPELKEDENCLNVALMRVLTDKFRTPEQLMSDGQFLNDYVFSSERVRNAIIADYLDDVRRGVPPYTLHGGGMQCVAPKVKPKTIEEAGAMFLKNNK
ncbi:MAG: hypothetical protein NC037_06145 [Bacteroides sp.]|nr:hypothetical protein [Bacillota bacterium]MCM1393810.1 hypothetical protein [[Eubacterium] siraeum]MCM1456085.1 hypothetical protein [Bacteroides sp.]